MKFTRKTFYLGCWKDADMYIAIDVENGIIDKDILVYSEQDFKEVEHVDISEDIIKLIMKQYKVLK